ncbi:hypothetical protein [Myceligenerans cantabricum]
MLLRAVILPATVLLVPGASGASDPLADVRLAVGAALAGLAQDGPPMVLAHGSSGARGPEPLRPSLAAAGVADHMLPDGVLEPWAVPAASAGARHDETGRTARAEPSPAGTAASVALFCLGLALGDRAAEVPVLEVPARHAAGTDLLARHLDTGGTLVVAAGAEPGPAAVAPADPAAPAPGVAALLAAVGADAWTTTTRTFARSHDHLPAEYRLTTLAAAEGSHATS